MHLTTDLLDGAREYPERVAVVDKSGTHTYAELLERATALAHRLTRAHRQRVEAQPTLSESRVAILVAPGAEWVVALWAVWIAGGVAVPLSPQHPPAEWRYMLDDSGAFAVIADTRHASRVHETAPEGVVQLMVHDGDAVEGPVGDRVRGDVPPPAARGAQPRPDAHRAHQIPETRHDTPLPDSHRALILYTSGTTGKPKGVVHTHGSLRAQVSSLAEGWEITPDDHSLLVLPLHHVHGVVNVVCCALAVGARVTMHERFDAPAVWEALAAGGINVFHAVPTIWRRLLEHADSLDDDSRTRGRSAIAAMRLLVSGSAALPVSLLERWREFSGHVLLERYGMTELGMVLSNPLHGTRVAGHVGNALPGVSVRAVDDAGEPVPEGAVGSLEVRGATVMREYWQRPAETAAAFRDGWFRTGDVAVHDEVEGGRSWRLLGRESTDIIKTGGYKVSALEIEEVLRTHHAVRECAVVGLPDDEWGECVAVAVELSDVQPSSPPASLTLEELRAFAKERLAVYKVPTRLQVVSTLPRNAMGKVVKPDVRRGFA